MLTETDRVLAVSESLCHPWGTLNIPGGLSETESAMTVSECKCGQTGGTRRPQRKRIFLHALVLDRGGSPG